MICSSQSPWLGRAASLLFCAIGLVIFSPSAKATLTFNNGGFETCATTNGGSTTKTCTNPGTGNGGFAIGITPPNGGSGNYLQGWSILNPNNLHCVVTNPANDNNLCGAGWTSGTTNLQLYALAPTSPTGGHYVIMDADSVHNYNGTLYQTATGLTVGQTYTLSFYQAAGQQAGNMGSATDWWSVVIGGSVSGGSITGGTAYGSVSQNDIFWRDQSGLGTPDIPSWQKVAYTFKATAASELISFTSNSLMSNPSAGVPPYLFLDGVSLQAAPEPASVFLTGFGALGVLVVRRRMVKRAARKNPQESATSPSGS